MKVFIIVIVVLLVFASIGLYARNKASRLTDKHDLVKSIDIEVSKFFKVEKSSAVTVGVIKNGRTHFMSYGLVNKDAPEPEPPDAQTLFQIGSLTKVFTVSLLQVLSDKGVVDIDATLETLIGDDTPLSDQAARITLRQLATHTSGLPRVPEAMLTKVVTLAGKDNVMDDPYSFLTPADMFAYLHTTEDAKAPGKFAYSNYGMGMLGHVLEKLTDDSLENLFRVYLFQPLGMNKTGIVIPEQLEPTVAQGYTDKGEPAGLWHFSVLAGAGAVYSNAEDMLKFLEASLDEGSEANGRFQAMTQPLQAEKSALGWMQPSMFEKFFGNGNFFWHNGLVGGYATYMSISTVDNTGVIVLTSRGVDASMLGVMLTRTVRTQSWSEQN